MIPIGECGEAGSRGDAEVAEARRTARQSENLNELLSQVLCEQPDQRSAVSGKKQSAIQPEVVLVTGSSPRLRNLRVSA